MEGVFKKGQKNELQKCSNEHHGQGKNKLDKKLAIKQFKHMVHLYLATVEISVKILKGDGHNVL